MAINIKKLNRQSNIKDHDLKGYIAKVIKKGKVSLDDVVKYSLKNQPIDERTAKFIIGLVVDGIVDYLADGYYVDLGLLGQLSPAVRGKMKENADDITLKDLGITVNYRISKELKSKLEDTEMNFVDEK
jgi:MOSC domain-containing protein YiiM